jgi:hypothetical protein
MRFRFARSQWALGVAASTPAFAFCPGDGPSDNVAGGATMAQLADLGEQIYGATRIRSMQPVNDISSTICRLRRRQMATSPYRRFGDVPARSPTEIDELLRPSQRAD